MKTLRTLFLALLFLLMGTPTLMAGSLSELNNAIVNYYNTGEISDASVFQMLSELIGEAQLAPNADAENAVRGSIIDVCQAFNGSGITSTAASHLISLAQP